MKINKVTACDLQTNEKQVFTFGTAKEGKAVIVKRGGRLKNYFEFCFNPESECTRDVEIEFQINRDEYSLSRLHNEDGTTRTVLKKKIDDSYQVVARSHAVEYIEQIAGAQLADILKHGDRKSVV